MRNPDLNKLVDGHKDYENEFKYAIEYANYTFSASDMKTHTEDWIMRKFPNTSSDEFIEIGAIAWLLNCSGYVRPHIIQNISQRINKISKNDIK